MKLLALQESPSAGGMSALELPPCLGSLFFHGLSDIYQVMIIQFPLIKSQLTRQPLNLYVGARELLFLNVPRKKTVFLHLSQCYFLLNAWFYFSATRYCCIMGSLER